MKKKCFFLCRVCPLQVILSAVFFVPAFCVCVQEKVTGVEDAGVARAPGTLVYTHTSRRARVFHFHPPTPSQEWDGDEGLPLSLRQRHRLVEDRFPGHRQRRCAPVFDHIATHLITVISGKISGSVKPIVQ